MTRKKEFFFKNTLKSELIAFRQDQEGLLNKDERWGDDFKKSIIKDAKEKGYIILRNDISIVWNNSFFEYILYINGEFCGYFDFSFFVNQHDDPFFDIVG